MSTHYAIMIDLSNAPKDNAIVDVTAASPGAVDLTLFPPGAAPVPFQVPMNADHFATSASHTTPNLFGLTGQKGALVKAHVDAMPSCALLRQTSTGGVKVLLNIPPVEKSLGRNFGVPIGTTGATLIIGNPSGVAISVNVRRGAVGPIPTAVQVPAWGYLEVPAGAVESGVFMTSAADFFVQLAIDDGKTDVAFLLPL